MKGVIVGFIVCTLAGATTAPAQTTCEPDYIRSLAGLVGNLVDLDGSGVLAKVCPSLSRTSQPRQLSLVDRAAYPTPIPSDGAGVINLSTRLLVQASQGVDNVGIGGFIITGTAPKRVLLRGIGPSLTNFGVPNALANPVLELNGPPPFATIINNDWKDTQEALIEATGIPPTNDLESALLVTLDPGAYTAVVRGLPASGNLDGVALVEIYDLDQGVASELANIATRAFVSTGNDILIAGFILGNGASTNKIVLRGIGPSLTQFGVPDALANPTLELRDSSGTLLMLNNDWQDNPAQAGELTKLNLAPTNVLESGIVSTLAPGPYTALLAGVDNGTGNALVEVYVNPFVGSGGTPTPTPGTPTPTPAPTPIGCSSGVLSENFDNVTPPALPSGWEARNASGPAPLWVTSNAGVPAPVAESLPNAASIDDPGVLSDKRLDSVPYVISQGAQLVFRNNHDLESEFDGGVLEISIGGGTFLDILLAGGSFAAGGYNATLSSEFGSPLSGRAAWTGSSGGFFQTIVNLPAAAIGQTVVFRWRMGSDTSTSSSGWRVDSIQLFCTGGVVTPTPTVSPTPTPSPTPAPQTVPLPIASLNTTIPIGTVLIHPVTTTQITGAENYVGFQGDFTFDETVVTFASPFVESAGLTAGNWNVKANILPGHGPIRILRVSAFSLDFTPLSGSGVLYNLRLLRVSSQSGASTPLNWAADPDNFIFIDVNLEIHPPTQTNGLITITTPESVRGVPQGD